MVSVFFLALGQRTVYFPRRYIAALLGFFGEACLYAMQVDLNLTLLGMSRMYQTSNRNNTKQVVECPMLVERAEKANGVKYEGPLYDWDTTKQSIILQSFYYGYILTQIPGGYLTQVFSPKWIFGMGLLMSALMCLLTPAAAAIGPSALVTVRVMQGLSQGVGKPSIYALISRWSPELERSRFSTFLLTGGQLGSIIAMPLTGLISSSKLLGGWPAVFSFFGIVSCIWFVFWTWFMYDSPWDHPYISMTELQLYKRNKGEMLKKKHTVPWKEIFSSMTVWAVIVPHFGSGFGFLTLFTELPHYLENVLHFNIRENGVSSAIPYVVQAIAGYMASYVADHLRDKSQLDITTIRKIFNSIGFYGPAFFLMCITVSGCHSKIIVGLLSFAMAFAGFSYSGYAITYVDLSPEFAGTLFGIANTFSSICGILAPALVGFLTSKSETISDWNNMFYIVAVVYVITGTFYNVFATAETQTFGVIKDEMEMTLMTDGYSEKN